MGSGKSRTHAERMAAGLCYNCGRRPPEPGRVNCRRCASKANARMTRLRNSLKAEGVCPTCHRQGYHPTPKRRRKRDESAA